jgi:hypothetical protein
MHPRTIAIIAFVYVVACAPALANCDPAKGAVDIDSCLVKGPTPVHGTWQVLGLKEWQKNGDIGITKRGFTWGKCRQIPAEIKKRDNGKFLVTLLHRRSCDISGWNFVSIEFALASESYLTFFEDPAGSIAIPVKSPIVIRRDELRK